MRPKNRYPGSAAARPSRAAGPGLTLPHQPLAQATRPPPPVPPGRRSRSLFCLHRAPGTQREGTCELLRDNAAPRIPASPGAKRSTGMLPARRVGAQGNPPPSSQQTPQAPTTYPGAPQGAATSGEQVCSRAASSSFGPRASAEPVLPLPAPLQGLWVPFPIPMWCWGRLWAQSPRFGRQQTRSYSLRAKHRWHRSFSSGGVERTGSQAAAGTPAPGFRELVPCSPRGAGAGRCPSPLLRGRWEKGTAPLPGEGPQSCCRTGNGGGRGEPWAAQKRGTNPTSEHRCH